MHDPRPAAPRRVSGAPCRVVFMGTPDFAVPSLERMVADHAVVGVYTQPDRPAGRGRSVRASPVKRLAEHHGIPVYQPKSLKRDPAAVDALRALEPDVVVVAAYGLILPPAVLTAAPAGSVNVHASLLPRWRGAAPVHHAILAGDAETGATIMLIDEGLDTGPILAQTTVPIPPDATTGALTAALAACGADLLGRTLPRWLAGEIEPRPQDDAAATLAPRLGRDDGRLDWREPAGLLARRVRAFDPWPGTHTTWAGGMLKVLAATAVESPGGADPAGRPPPPGAADGAVPGLPPGTVVAASDGLRVATGAGWLRLDRVQPAGGRPMTGLELARGRPDVVGARLGRDGRDAGEAELGREESERTRGVSG